LKYHWHNKENVVEKKFMTESLEILQPHLMTLQRVQENTRHAEKATK